MANRKVAAKAALVPVNSVRVDVLSPEYNRADMVKRLADADAKQRVLLLSALPMGEVAALGGIVAKIGASVNEVLAIRMAELHGADWAKIAKSLPGDLNDADKERRKQINASLESIRETIKSNSGGNADKAREIVRSVKEYGLGKRKSRGAGSTKKQRLDVWAAQWEQFPMAYRRIKNDDMDGVKPAVADALLGIADAYAAFFTALGIKPQAVIECKGDSDWNPIV